MMVRQSMENSVGTAFLPPLSSKLGKNLRWGEHSGASNWATEEHSCLFFQVPHTGAAVFQQFEMQSKNLYKKL